MTYRNGVELRTEDNVNFVLNHGALGDAIASLPAVLWARANHDAAMKMTVWCAEYQVPLFKALLEARGIRVMPLTQLKAVLDKGSPEYAGACVMNCTMKNTVTRNRCDMAEYAFLTLLDRQADGEWELDYPTAPLGPRVVGEEYVVIPVGATNEASMFRGPVLAGVVEGVLARGFLPVLTGKKGRTGITMMSQGKPLPLVVHDKVDELPADLLARCRDMRDATTLVELRDLCGHAEAVVGVDGGTLHLAGTTDVPIVYGCTRVKPHHRGIVRNGEWCWRLKHVEPRELECAGCQSNWTLMFGYDFSKCGYGDYACTHQLHPDDFLAALDSVMEE